MADQISRRQAGRLFLAAAGSMAIAGCAASEPGGPAPATRPAAPPPPGPTPAEKNQLHQMLRGRVRSNTDDGYDADRRSMVFNGAKPDRKPQYIVHAEDVADVQATVRYARANGLKIAVRGGGHHWDCPVLRDGGILLDVSALRSVFVDPTGSGLVSAEPGVKNQDLVKLLTPHGLAFPIGHCPGVPLSGYLLGGGFGWNSGAWGPACLGVRAVRIVTADGNIVQADATQNQDLFWAARGAGAGFFGVVIQYQLQTYPIPKAIRSQNLFFPLSDAAAVGKWLAAVSPKLAKEVELTCVLTTAPPGLPPGAPPAGQRVIAVSSVAFGDTDQQSKQLLQPLAAPPAPLKPAITPVSPTSFDQLLAEMARFYPADARYTVNMAWCGLGAAELVPRVAKSVADCPSPGSLAMVVLPPPPPKDAPPPDAALSMFGPALVGVYGIWHSPADDAANVAWVKSTADAVRDATIGHYIGESAVFEPGVPQRCFSPQAWDRLRTLKSKYDPAGVFHDYPGVG